MTVSDIILLAIGAGLSLLGSLTFALISRLMNRVGTFKIFAKTVFLKADSGTCLQIITNGTNRMLQIPLWIEFVNTKKVPVIIRDLNIELFYDKQRVACTTQINKSKARNGSDEFYGKNGSYSFVVPPYFSQHYELLFCLNENISDQYSFNKLKIAYFNAKGKRKRFTYKDFDGGWNSLEKIKDDDWYEIN